MYLLGELQHTTWWVREYGVENVAKCMHGRKEPLWGP